MTCVFKTQINQQHYQIGNIQSIQDNTNLKIVSQNLTGLILSINGQNFEVLWIKHNYPKITLETIRPQNFCSLLIK